MNSKNVLIIGVTGQDGSNMADYLLANTDHYVFGGVRRISVPNYGNIENAIKDPRFKLVSIDLSDAISVKEAVRQIKPDYMINLAANSFVASSWDMPLQVMDVNSLGVIRCLEAIREHRPSCRFYSAGSSEEMGNVIESPQDIYHPLRPRSIYGVSKAAARLAVKVYRESYGLYAIHGILYNHEGLRRGQEFVTRKITMGVARIKMALEQSQPFEPIELGNLNARRDWSDSSDFVDGIWRMVNQEKHRSAIKGDQWLFFNEFTDHPELNRYEGTEYLKEYILASGEMHSIREFVEAAFKHANIDGHWSFAGTEGQSVLPIHEVYRQNDLIFVRINPKFYRPADVEELCGNSQPVRDDLGWSPKIGFKELVGRMVDNDLNLLKKSLNISQ